MSLPTCWAQTPDQTKIKQTNNFPDGFADMINLFGISGGLDLGLTADGAGIGRGIKCSHCGKIFATIGSSRRHYREVHAQSSKIECQYCGTTFGRKENLVRHISKFHNPSIVDQ